MTAGDGTNSSGDAIAAAPAPAVPAAPQLTQRQIVTVIGGLMVGLLLAALDGTIVATALPTIAGKLGGLEHIA